MLITALMSLLDYLITLRERNSLHTLLISRIISSLAYIHCLLHTQLLLNTIKIIYSVVNEWFVFWHHEVMTVIRLFPCWANHWYDLSPLLTRPITLDSVSGFAESLCPVSGNILIKSRVFNWVQNIKSTPAECPVAQANQAEVTNTPWHAACLQRPVLELLRFIC